MFDDGAGITLNMVQKLLRAANFLAIQPLIDGVCSVITKAINNEEVTQVKFIDAAEQLLFGAQPRADGRQTVCDTFALLQDVHSYQPELAASWLPRSSRQHAPLLKSASVLRTLWRQTTLRMQRMLIGSGRTGTAVGIQLLLSLLQRNS